MWLWLRNQLIHQLLQNSKSVFSCRVQQVNMDLSIIYSIIVDTLVFLLTIIEEPMIESATLQLCTLWTSIGLLLSALLQGLLLCYQPAVICQFRGYKVTNEFFSNYCLTTGFNEEDNPNTHKNYQFIGLWFLFSAVISYCPRLIWKKWEKKVIVWNIFHLPSNVSMTNVLLISIFHHSYYNYYERQLLRIII